MKFPTREHRATTHSAGWLKSRFTAWLLSLCFLLWANPLGASHFRGAATSYTISASGVVTVVCFTVWRADFIAGPSFTMRTARGGGGTSLGSFGLTETINPFSTGSELSGAQFIVRRDTFTFNLAGRTNGVYYAWWLGNARVAGINNVGETSFSSELAIPYVAGQASAGPTMIPATIDIIGRGYDYNQNLNSTDPDGTPVSYQLVTNPNSPDFGPQSSIPGLSISQIGTMSISASNTAGLNLGRWVYKVRVTDGVGATAERDILVVVQAAGSNTPPVLNPIGSQFVAVGHALSFPVSATDPTNGQLLTLRAQRVPPGAAFPQATNTTPATVSSTFT